MFKYNEIFFHYRIDFYILFRFKTNNAPFVQLFLITQIPTQTSTSPCGDISCVGKTRVGSKSSHRGNMS